MSKNSAAKKLSREKGLSYSHALRVARKANALVKQDGISFEHAVDRILGVASGAATLGAATLGVARLGAATLGGVASVPGVGRPGSSVRELLVDAIDGVCSALTGEELEYGANGELIAGPPFADVDLPHQTVETITVELVELDENSLSYSVTEDFDGGTQVGTAEIRADVSFEGYVYKGDLGGLGDKVSVIQYDWNDHMSCVGFTSTLTLMFTTRIETGEPEVESVELVGATDDSISQDPHAPR